MTKKDENRYIGGAYYDAEFEVLRAPNGDELTLRPQSLQVLKVLLEADGELVTKNALMETVWRDTVVTDDSLVQCISEIRKVLGPEDGARLKTVARRGYRLLTTTGTGKVADAGASKPPGPSRIRPWMPALAVLVLAAVAVAWYTIRFLPDTDPQSEITIAVLPFANLDKDPAQDHLSTGLAEDLLTDLSRIHSIKVMSRSSSFAFADVEEPLSAIAAALPVTHVIDGTVRRDGERLRFSVQLIDARSGLSLWAERYDREFTSLFALQDEVRGQIITALSLRLGSEEQAQLEATTTTDVTAYELMLSGRRHESTFSREGIAQAIAMYEQALAIDPNYGEAIARLANMHDFNARYGWSDDPAADAVRALELAETAVARAPLNPFARWSYGRILARRVHLDPDAVDKALAQMRRAIEISPNYADAYAFISLIYSGTDQVVEARAAINTALRLNPDAPSWYIQNQGIAAYMSADYRSAINAFQRTVERNSASSFARSWLAAALAMDDQVDEAKWEIDEAISLGAPESVRETLTANSIISAPNARTAYANGLKKAGLTD